MGACASTCSPLVIECSVSPSRLHLRMDACPLHPHPCVRHPPSALRHPGYGSGKERRHRLMTQHAVCISVKIRFENLGKLGITISFEPLPGGLSAGFDENPWRGLVRLFRNSTDWRQCVAFTRLKRLSKKVGNTNSGDSCAFKTLVGGALMICTLRQTKYMHCSILVQSIGANATSGGNWHCVVALPQA